MTTLLLRKPAYLPKQLKNGFMRSYAFVTTRKPIIPSYYRFAFKGGVNLYGGGYIEYYHITCLEHITPIWPTCSGAGIFVWLDS
ncbi:hypothetical protein DTO027B5_8131 [Paecilomyces variotii]|nr:hypothetical protein DTO169C6_780 [Paecilomyces variotii]KAJ9262694.1 hypothetical protein DTO195F2_3415 [Paecilomyces variotii]KAJ9286357.1 hypothetical protein DTO021C3_6067 [Paecilomyces variotii]KAJ9306951.1 hypothetical protein DTO217A2_3541 [Paecilomyces variotii]KAJ9319895.1 hypothetical protein DTO027B3_9098 [Paecilomyces variotii]